MVDENTNVCDECGYEGSEETCPHCGGVMSLLEDLDEEEDEEVGSGGEKDLEEELDVEEDKDKDKGGGDL